MPDFDLAALRAELSRDEGRRHRAYKDSEGIWTVGVGFNLEANAITDDVIDRLLDVSIEQAAHSLDLVFPRWRELDEDRRRVLLNMAFNLGPVRLGRFRAFLGALTHYVDTGVKSWLEIAANEMLDSKWADQVGPRASRLVARMRG